MKRLNNIFAFVAVAFLLTGCSLYKELHGTYESQSSIPANAYGTSQDI